MAQYKPFVNDDSKTYAEKDYEAIQEYNKEMKAAREREVKMYRQWAWRGNSLPPFKIEPLKTERARLDTPMTDEDRLARRQWLRDQHCTVNEPVYVPERSPRNFIRRAWGGLWDSYRRALTPVIGRWGAAYARLLTPKALGTLMFFWFAWYNVKYRPSTWEDREAGWHMFRARPTLFPGDPGWPNVPTKAHDEYYAKGFNMRTSHLGDKLTTPRVEADYPQAAHA